MKASVFCKEVSSSQEFHTCFFTLQPLEVTLIKFSMEGGIPVCEDRLYALIYRIIYGIGYISLYIENH